MLELVPLFLSVIATIAAAVSSFAAWRATRYAERQINAADKATEANVFIEIDKRWREIYPIYRSVSAESPRMELLQESSDRNSFMASDYWLDRRPLFAFYEFIGACIATKILRPEVVYRLVNVNPRIWDQFEPMIREMRQMAPYPLPELYQSWEMLSIHRKAYKIDELGGLMLAPDAEGDSLKLEQD